MTSLQRALGHFFFLCHRDHIYKVILIKVSHFFQAKRFLKNVDKDLARIKERLDIDDPDDDSENDEKNDQMTSLLMIRGESIWSFLSFSVSSRLSISNFHHI